MSEARTTDWARGRQVHIALIALRSGDSFLPGQGVISGLGDRGSRRACYLGNFSLDSESWESDYFCHDVKRQKILQLTESSFAGQRGKANIDTTSKSPIKANWFSTTLDYIHYISTLILKTHIVMSFKKRKRMDLIEGTNWIRVRVLRTLLLIVSFSTAERMCAEWLTKERVCADSGKEVHT